MVCGLFSSRYTSVSRSNILNLKKQLHDVKKNTDTVSQYLQRIKESRDKLAAMGTLVDDEDLLHIVLKGLHLNLNLSLLQCLPRVNLYLLKNFMFQ